jgi:hypothetical protein
MPSGSIKCRILKDVRKEGIVDLQQEAGLNDRFIFGAKCGAGRLKELFFGAIVFVGSHAVVVQ